MFVNNTNTNTSRMFFAFDVYNFEFSSYKNTFAYDSDTATYITNTVMTENTWYHAGAVMTGTGNMVGNKIYINGENKPLSWAPNESGNGKAIFQNYINLGGWMKNTDYYTYGYESHIYYFDREL